MTVFDPGQLTSAFVVSAPALAGEYVFQLTAANEETGGAGSVTVVLRLE